MTNDHNKTKVRTLGSYYTPKLTVKYMVEKTMPYITSSSKILDPACGDGVFLKEYIKQKISKKQLYAYDINPDVEELIKPYTKNIIITDSLQNLKGKYDIIIANPPYSSNECNYIKKFRPLLKKMYYPVPPSNLYSLFLHNSIRHLNVGGIICFLVLDSFISNVYYKPLREEILKNCKIKEITLAPRTLFHKVSADVRTCILILEKCSNPVEKKKNMMCLMDRVEKEEDYWNDNKKQFIKQSEFYKLPNYTFFINIPKNIIKIIINPKKRLGDVMNGGTGISTGKDNIFLKSKDKVKGNDKWVKYYKNGIKMPYYYEPQHYIEKDYKSSMKKSKNYMIRNEKFFFKEGITCSSVGVNFSASYMEKGNLFGVNANLFSEDKIELMYCLGILNSKIARYIMKFVLNRTNNISSTYIKTLPYIDTNLKQKKHIAKIVKSLIKKKKNDPECDIINDQEYLDIIFYDIYKISKTQQKLITKHVNNIYNKL